MLFVHNLKFNICKNIGEILTACSPHKKTDIRKPTEEKWDRYVQTYLIAMKFFYGGYISVGMNIKNKK